MAEISSVEIKDDGIVLSLKISKEEYEFLKQATTDLMVIPADANSMNHLLTTGKLGNSSRLMLPKKTLDRLGVRKIERKVPGNFFRLEGNVYLVVRLDGKYNGIPKFGGESSD